MPFEQRRQTHDQFYEEVRAWFKSIGFETESSTYHDHWGSKAVDAIRAHFDPTSLYVRFRADNVAVHVNPSVGSIQWDTKTNQSSLFGNMALELIPLILHKIMSDNFAVPCLYCYRDSYRNLEAGFWTNSIPPLMRIEIPTYRWHSVMVNWFKEMCQAHFPTTRVALSDKTSGSGTPFVLVSEYEVRKLCHWKLLVEQLIAPKELPKPAVECTQKRLL